MGPADSSWTHHALVLLRHKCMRLFRGFLRAQQGHRGMLVASARINLRRIVAIELGAVALGPDRRRQLCLVGGRVGQPAGDDHRSGRQFHTSVRSPQPEEANTWVRAALRRSSASAESSIARARTMPPTHRATNASALCRLDG